MQEAKLQDAMNFSSPCSWILPLLLAAILAACKGPAGPAGPALTGDVIGYCFLYDSTGTKLTDFSGVTVSAEGASPTTLTGPDGLYRLRDVPTGTYALRYEKSGYGTYKRPGFLVVGGGPVNTYSVGLYPLPKFQVVNLTANNAGGSINITGTLTGNTTSYRYVMIFYGRAPSVSSDPASYVGTYSAVVYPGSSTMLAMIPDYYLYEMGFAKSDTLYLNAYGMSGWSSYLDFATMKYVYPNLSTIPSNVVTTTVP